MTTALAKQRYRRGTMEANENITYWDKLRLRAIEVERTMRHLEKERQRSRRKHRVGRQSCI